MEQGCFKREGRGRLRQCMRRVVGDKGYSSRRIRGWLRRHGIHHTFPHKRKECQSGPFDCGVYRERKRVGRLINRLKQCSRVATCAMRSAPRTVLGSEEHGTHGADERRQTVAGRLHLRRPDTRRDQFGKTCGGERLHDDGRRERIGAEPGGLDPCLVRGHEGEVGGQLLAERGDEATLAGP